jgi:putative ABC transport system ATP-binding protein
LATIIRAVSWEIGKIRSAPVWQRLAAARALANRPSLILADEPTAALDSERGRQVMELFRKVAREQKGAVIVVTHDHRALDVFDTIYEMEDGMIRKQQRAAD